MVSCVQVGEQMAKKAATVLYYRVIKSWIGLVVNTEIARILNHSYSHSHSFISYMHFVTDIQWRRQNVSAAGAQPGHQNLDWGSWALYLQKNMRSLLIYF